MVTVGRQFSKVIPTGSETFILQGHAQTVVEIHPTSAGTATLYKSAASATDVAGGADTVYWFPFPDMPTGSAYEEMVSGATALKLTVHSGEFAINICRAGADHE